jgi:hypothetical protein
MSLKREWHAVIIHVQPHAEPDGCEYLYISSRCPVPEIAEQFKLAIEKAADRNLDEQVNERAKLLKDLANGPGKRVRMGIKKQRKIKMPKITDNKPDQENKKATKWKMWIRRISPVISHLRAYSGRHPVCTFYNCAIFLGIT